MTYKFGTQKKTEYEFSKTKKDFLVFGNSYFVFFAYQTYRSSVTDYDDVYNWMHLTCRCRQNFSHRCFG